MLRARHISTKAAPTEPLAQLCGVKLDQVRLHTPVGPGVRTRAADETLPASTGVPGAQPADSPRQLIGGVSVDQRVKDALHATQKALVATREALVATRVALVAPLTRSAVDGKSPGSGSVPGALPVNKQ